MKLVDCRNFWISKKFMLLIIAEYKIILYLQFFLVIHGPDFRSVLR